MIDLIFVQTLEAEVRLEADLYFTPIKRPCVAYSTDVSIYLIFHLERVLLRSSRHQR
jgi:hypothetical protein